MNNLVLLLSILISLPCFAGNKILQIDNVPSPVVKEGNAVDYFLLNAQMTNLVAFINLSTGTLNIQFDYPKQGWILCYGNKDGIIHTRNSASERESYFEYPQRFLITLKDKYKQRIDQFQTQQYYYPSKVIEVIKYQPNLSPLQIPIEDYTGNVLNKTGNKITFQLDAQTVNLVSKVSVCFATNKVISNTDLKFPPYVNSNEVESIPEDPDKKLWEELRLNPTVTITVDSVSLECGRFSDGRGDSCFKTVSNGALVLHGPSWQQVKAKPFLEYYAESYFWRSATFKNGELHGPCTIYYDYGKTIMSIYNYASSKLNGPFVEYYCNGKKRAEGAIVNYKRDGLSISYLMNGDTSHCERYSKGVKIETLKTPEDIYWDEFSDNYKRENKQKESDCIRALNNK